MTPGMWLFEEPLFRNSVKLVEEVCAPLLEILRVFAVDHIPANQWDDGYEYVFASLTVSPAGDSGKM